MEMRKAMAFCIRLSVMKTVPIPNKRAAGFLQQMDASIKKRHLVSRPVLLQAQREKPDAIF